MMPGEVFERVAGYLIRVRYDFGKKKKKRIIIITNLIKIAGGEEMDLPAKRGEILTPYEKNKDWYLARNVRKKKKLFFNNNLFLKLGPTKTRHHSCFLLCCN